MGVRKRRSSDGRLAEYRHKRDFSVTPEPAPSAAKPRAGTAATFMVHKHDARRLHYDLRLEIDGVLASWAVPKGPSFDPAEKRLAVETEDHPLEYGQFEGRIPDGEYGAGDSIIWDRGTFDTVPPGQAAAQKDKGHLEVVFDGEKLRGRWHLVRTGGRRRPTSGKPQWLLFKAHDAEARPGYDVVAEEPASVASGRVATRGPVSARALRATHPAPEKLLERVSPPMLATLSDHDPPDPDNWVAELKYDGFRALGAVSGGRVALWSRNQLDLGDRFPEIARALGQLVVGEAVLDGEAVSGDVTGAGRRFVTVTGGPAVLYAFDLLWLEGTDLRGRPLEERRELLESLLQAAPPSIRLAERLEGGPVKALREAVALKQEGIVLKRRGSTYEARRSRAWLKRKALASVEAAVVGFTPLERAGRAVSGSIGALVLAVVDEKRPGTLRYAGKVGTGFDTAMRKRLWQLLHPHERSTPPEITGLPKLRDARWVEPRVVVEVRFSEWTEDGKLRHPSFHRIRDDKGPAETGEAAERGQAPRTPRSRVTLTNPKKELWPGITKTDLAAYYQALSGPLLDALADRPLSLEHWPKGIRGPSFFHQNMDPKAPSWLRVVETPTRSSGGRKRVRHLVVDSEDALRWLAQQSVLTIHAWSSRAPHLGMPDWVAFDLDPSDSGRFDDVIEPALALKALLDELGLPSVPKTSGKRGLHVFVPLLPGHTHEDAVRFAEHIGQAITSVLPATTMERALAARKGRLYFDCYQNGYGKTLVSAYSPRAAPGGPVSTPLDWREVRRGLDPDAFTVNTLPARVAEVGDLFARARQHAARLPHWK